VNVASFALPVGKNAVVAVALGATLPSGAGPRRLDVTIGAFDLRGRSVAVRSQTLELSSELASTGEAQDGLVARLDLPPGRYELRAAVKDQTSGAVGSVFSFVDVPAFARGDTAVSGLVLHRNRALLIADNPLADVVPILPTVARTFSRDDKVSAFLRIYQPNEPQLVSVMTRVVDTTNRTVFEQRKELASEAFRARTADFDVPLPLSQLVPGNYLLKIEVTRGEWRAERDARFEISSKR